MGMPDHDTEDDHGGGRRGPSWIFFVLILVVLDARMALAATCLLPVVVGFAVVFFLRVRHAFEASDEAEVSVEVSGARVTVRRAVAGPASPGAAGGEGAGAGAGADVEEEDGLVRVTSPMVGTFYRRPAPDQPAFVEEGSRVEAGDTLCLIEAMKLFNEIVAETAGTVRAIALEDAAPAEFGQLLFLIEP